MVQNPKCKRVDMMFQDIWIKTIIVQNSEEGEGREGKKKVFREEHANPKSLSWRGVFLLFFTTKETSCLEK